MPAKSSHQEQVEDTKKKIALIEGDRRAYFEGAEWTIKEQKTKIGSMRKENKELHKHKHDRLMADEDVINQALKEFAEERNAFRNKSGDTAVVRMDEKVRDRIKMLNRMRYQTVVLQKNLEEQQTRYDQKQKDAEQAVATDSGESPEAQNLRNLENRLDKANLKCKEAEHIRKTYCQIKSKLEDEHKTFETQLDDMEQEIKRCRKELADLRVMRNDAIIARDASRGQLETEEKKVYSERKEREVQLQKVKKEADEKKQLQEQRERRLQQRGSLQQDELTAEQHQQLLGEDEQQKISSYEEMFRRIKEATGVSDTKEVVLRFDNQGDTAEHLEDLKKENEKQINRLREDKEKLQNEFEEMKYSGEAKLSSGQRLLEEFETHLAEEEKRRDEAQDKLDKSSKILIDAKSGVEHLNEKLKHLKAPSSQVGKSKISPSSDEYVLDQLSVCEEKLLKVLEDLDGTGKDLSDINKQMEEEEKNDEDIRLQLDYLEDHYPKQKTTSRKFHNTQELKLPVHNTRIKFPQSQKDGIYEDEEDSGEDEDIMSRNALKKQSQQIIDQKTKRKAFRKKKKAK